MSNFNTQTGTRPVTNPLSLKRLITALLAVAMILSAYVPVDAATIADLLAPNATIVSGDKVFSNFAWTSNAAGTGTAVAPADVTVLPFSQVVLGELEYGLEFLTPTLNLPGGGGLSATLNYSVTPNIPGRLISDNTLTMVAGGGGGNASIVETPTDAAGLLPLLAAPKTTIWTPFFSNLSVHADYLNPVLAVDVSTQISLANATGPGPQISSFTQTFSQIPEPATAVLAGLAAAGICLFVSRRRRARA
jgi:hypothetical protein